MANSLNRAGIRPTSPHKSPSSGYICGPVVDSIFIIGAPIVALMIACPLFSMPKSNFDISIQTNDVDLRQLFIIAFVQAHLFLVYFRSHANQNIFQLYPFRFTVVPLLVFAAGSLSSVMLGILGVVAVWWDVYHSSLQTFGFGRIYDSKRKNNATVGRSLDYWMNLFVYLGPVLAGVHFADHVDACKREFALRSGDQLSQSELLIIQLLDFPYRLMMVWISNSKNQMKDGLLLSMILERIMLEAIHMSIYS